MIHLDTVIQQSQELQSGFRNLLYHKSLVMADGFQAYDGFCRALPAIYRTGLGKIIYNRRNQLREIEYGGHTFVVKSYQIPHLINRLVYGFLRPSKARRSYEYAEMLVHQGFGSPQPVAYYTERFLGKSDNFPCAHLISIGVQPSDACGTRRVRFIWDGVSPTPDMDRLIWSD